MPREQLEISIVSLRDGEFNHRERIGRHLAKSYPVRSIDLFIKADFKKYDYLRSLIDISQIKPEKIEAIKIYHLSSPGIGYGRLIIFYGKTDDRIQGLFESVTLDRYVRCD